MRGLAAGVTLLLVIAAPTFGDDPRVAALAKRLNVKILLRGEPFPIEASYGRITGADADEADIKAFVPILLEELGRYPGEFIKKMDLERFVLCRDLAFAGQTRYAIPDFEHDTMYLHVAPPEHWRKAPRHLYDTYLRKIFHHELFHVVDYKDDGELYGDDMWKVLNPPGFAYGKGGAAMQNDPSVSLIRTDIPGFLNKYSTSGVEEDKAEIFANLMANREALYKHAEKDRVIQAKIAFMLQLLNRFSPSCKQLLFGKGGSVAPVAFATPGLKAAANGGAPACEALDRARADGRPVLVYFGRNNGEDRSGKTQVRAAEAFEEKVLADAKVRAASRGWTLLRFDLSDSDHAAFAGRFKVRKAPQILIFAPGAKRPKKLAPGVSAVTLARALAKHAPDDD